jgi:hypothetical protein
MESERNTAIDPEHKDWIDTASYTDLLRRWRFGKLGDTIFHGESGIYYRHMLGLRRSEISVREHVMASKQIGWER